MVYSVSDGWCTRMDLDLKEIISKVYYCVCMADFFKGSK